MGLLLRTYCFLSITFAGILFAGVLAEEKPDTTKIYTIGEITVTEHYRSAEVRSSAPLQILSSKNLQKLNVLQVSDAVKYFSGVTVKDYGGVGGLKTVSVRSLGAAHTAVSYDGIVLSDCQTGQVDIGRFSLDNVDMLSLYNGQSDNIFQPARSIASAALLNIRTLAPVFREHSSVNGKVSVKTGSFGLFNPVLLVRKKFTDVFSASVSGELLTAGGAYPYLMDYGSADGVTSEEKRVNSDVTNVRLEGAFYANFEDGSDGSLKAYYYDSERGLPGATIFYNENAFTSQRAHDRTFFVQSHFGTDLSEEVSVLLNAKYNSGYLNYLDTAVLNDAGYERSIYRQQEYYASFAMLYKAFRNISFSFSSDGFVNTLDADYENELLTAAFPHPVRYSWLSALSAKYVSENLLGTASLLSTVAREMVVDGAEAAPNRQKLSPYLSVTYKPFESYDLRFRFFYKDVFRMPTFNDLYYTRVGNAALKPEQTDQLNAGITWSVSPGSFCSLISLTVDAYRNYVKDKIVALPTRKNILLWSMTNLGKVQTDGLDITFETGLSFSDKIGLSLGGAYSYMKALDLTTPGGNTYQHQIPYTPRVSGSARAALETPWVDVAYSLLWSGKRYSGYQNYAENSLPGYADHSISVSREFGFMHQKIIINAEALNILNKNYAIIRWYPMPGRSFRTTIAWKW